MVTGLERATWVQRLSDSAFAAEVGVSTFARGRDYADRGMVRALAASQNGDTVVGTVEGSGSSTYQTYAAVDDMGRHATPPRWTSRCSCPVGSECKHVVAILLMARRGGLVRAGGTAPAEAADAVAHHDAPRESWRALLADAAGVVPSGTEAAAGSPDRASRQAGVAAGLVLDRRPLYWSGSARIGYEWSLRPVRRTRIGTWSRSLTWGEVLGSAGASAVVPAQRDALEAVFSLVLGAGSTGLGAGAPLWNSGREALLHGRSTVVLGSHPRLLTLLSSALAAGVELVAGEGIPGRVLLAEEVVRPEVRIDAVDGQPGSLRVRVVEAGLPDLPGEVHHCGDPINSVVLQVENGSVHLYRYDSSLGLSTKSIHVLTGAGVLVPAADVPEFAERFYPALRQVSTVRSSVPVLALAPGDAGADRPASAPAEVELTVHLHLTSPAPGEIDVRLGIAEDGHERVGSLSGDPVTADAEREVIRAAAASLSAVPGAVRTAPGGIEILASRVTLTGAAAADFTRHGLAALEADPAVTVTFEPDWSLAEVITEAPVISFDVTDRADTTDANRADRTGGRSVPADDWFDLHVTVEVAGQLVPIADLLSALAREQPYLWLESGMWLALDQPELLRLRELLDEAREMLDHRADPDRIPLTREQLDLWSELLRIGVVSAQSQRWAEHVERFALLAGSEPAAVPPSLRVSLRPYQLEGYQWLARLWDGGLGGILADDMGLGKTMQVIAVVCRAFDAAELAGSAPHLPTGPGAAVPAPVLVVAPTSVVGTWAGEFAAFAPHVPLATLTQTEGKRGIPLAQAIEGAAVVVTSYAVLRLDEEAFRAVRWAGLVIDEAQFVKNRQAKTHVALRKLAPPFTIVVTGTPLENSLMDLWALLSLAAPGLYPRPDDFTRLYRKPIESGQRPDLLDRLRRRIRPLMMRRTKEQVALDLPPKTIAVVSVAHHPVHRHIYEQHLARERQRILGLLEDPEANRVEILAALTRLRQLSLDPALVDEQYAGKALAAKLDHLVTQLSEIAAQGHRALVFSTFTSFLRRAEQALAAAGLVTCYLDGTTTNRQRVIRDFRQNGATAFLISLKAGGFGLTLTEADYVFVLDPWWNPAAEAQAIDRAHRIGQTKAVMVYRLVTAGTIEEKVVALQERKRDLFTRVVDGDAGPVSGALTAEDVRSLLWD